MFCKTHNTLNLDNKNSFQKRQGSVWFMFLKLFLKTVFENIDNTILVFFKNYSCFLNLVVKKKKKLRTKHVLFLFFFFFKT